MTKSIDQYAKEWQNNAEADALWVILTDSKYYGRKWNVDEFFATGEEEISRVFDFMKQGSIMLPTGSFLDFGCGVGRISNALVKRFEGGFGIDISEKMIEQAQAYVRGVKFMGNQSDSLDQFADDSIEFIYSHIVLQHIPNEYQRRYIDEFLRIMRPGGLAVFQIPIEIINPQDITPSLLFRLKQKVKRLLPFLVSMKRWLIPPKEFHCDFKYEMHPLADSEIRDICGKRGCVIEAAPATNSCEADHNGKVEFHDMNAHRLMLHESRMPNHYLSCMYFVKKPRDIDV